MNSIATVSKQGGRRYRQFGSIPSIAVRPFQSRGSATAVILVIGPIIFPAGKVYRPGARLGKAYRAGAMQGLIYLPGAQEGEIFKAGEMAGEIYRPGARYGEISG